MIPFRKTIGFRLILMGFLGLTLPLLIDASVVFTKRYEGRVDTTKRYLTESAVLRILPVASYQPFSSIAFDILVNKLGIETAFPKGPDAAINEKLSDLAKINDLDDLTVYTINEKGRYIVTASSDRTTIGDDETTFFANPTPFEVEAEFPDPIASYLFYRENFALYAVLAKGYKAPDGKHMGIVTAIVEMTEWVKEIFAVDTTYYPVRFALTNAQEIVMASTDETLLFHYFHDLSEKELADFKARQLKSISDVLPKKPLIVTKQMSSGGFIRFIWQGVEQFGVMEPMPWWSFSILSYASKREIYALPLEDFLGIFVSYTVILILGGICVYFITKRWMRPVQALGSVMMKVKEGDFSARYEEDKWGLQFNTLGLVFNDMIEKLLENKSKAELERVQRDLLAQELKLGKQAQKRLLKEPDQDFGVLDIAQAYIPASEVGGDFYDIFRKSNGKLVVTIADASGKGVLACCYSLAARNILRTLAMASDDVGEVLMKGNNLFCADTGESGMFVTVETVQYDYDSRMLTYHSLGHNPGIVCRKDGTIEMLSTHDMAMGVLEKQQGVKAGEKQLQEGDLFVLYTDGVTEMHNPESKLYGEKRLVKLIQEQRQLSAADLLKKIEEEVYAFAQGRAQFDDFTLIVVKINE